MAFTVTSRVNENTGETGVGSHTSGSFTPTANSRLFVFAVGQRDDHIASRNWQISDSQSLGWTQLDVSTLTNWGTESWAPNFALNVVCWYADIGASPASMTVTVDASISNEYYSLIAFDVTGFDPDTPFAQASVDNAVGTSGGAGDNNLSLTLTLGSNPTSGNLVVAMFGAGADGAGGFAVPSGYTALVNQDQSFTQGAVFYRTDTTTAAVTCSDLGQAVGNAGGIIFEMTLDAQEPGVIVGWPGTAASIPTGWSRVTALDGKHIKGAAASTDPGDTGGSATHSHTTAGHTHDVAHTHTVPDSPAASGSTNRDTGTVRPTSTHTHAGNPSTSNPTASTGSASPNTSSDSHDPPWLGLIWIQSDGPPTGIPEGAVVLWADDAGAPTNWNLADGASGRPDLRSRFAKGAAAAGNGGSTGGSATHTHTVADHNHGGTFAHDHPQVTSSQTASALTGGPISGANAQTATQTHTHALTIGSTSPAITGNTDSAASDSNEPPYVEMAFLVNETGGEAMPAGVIALWLEPLANIPAGWLLCDGTNGTPDLRSLFVKGATDLSEIGDTGGSTSHGSGHTATGHTHPIASHTHTVSAGSGAQSNETAGSTAVSTGGHTHPSWSNTGSAAPTSGTGTPTVNTATSVEPEHVTVAFIQFEGTAEPPVDLEVADAAQAHSAETPSLVQGYLLAVQETAQGQSADNVALAQQYNLDVQDASHAHGADNLDLILSLEVQDALHSHTAGSLDLVQSHALVVADALHSHSAGMPQLAQQHNLAVADASQAQSADNLALNTSTALEVQDAAHVQTSDNASLTQTHNLSVSDATHAHITDSIGLIQAHDLAVADAFHGQAAENVELEPETGITLVIQNALQAQAAESPALFQNHSLSVQDALHVQRADTVDWNIPPADDGSRGYATGRMSLAEIEAFFKRGELPPAETLVFLLMVMDE